ncbi:MAG: ABC transporter ATP-binding protein [Aquabacterium sp.]|uniref:ABC transporter ATP-binding protein n=1 Tax=Aquabacterium sp. TaxID=1872578 RepID=UPI003BED6071
MPLLRVHDLRLQYGSALVQEHINLELVPGQILAVMGGSGCGKSTLLKSLIGLLEPTDGHVFYGDQDYWQSSDSVRAQLRADIGVLFQSAALWSSMSVLDNVLLPLQVQNRLTAEEQQARALEVLTWVGMAEARDRMPADLSGGMKKRVGLARAIVARPHMLFLDEPSAGLDPISSIKLDRLILDIRDRTGAGIVIVTHELASIYALADSGIFLDADSKQPIAYGSPKQMRDDNTHPTVRAFMHREEIKTP